MRHAYDEYIEAVQDAVSQLPVCDLDEGWVPSPEGQGSLTWHESILAIGGFLSAGEVGLLLAAACQNGPVLPDAYLSSGS